MLLLKIKLIYSLSLFLLTVAWEYFALIRTVVLYGVITSLIVWAFLSNTTAFETTQSTFLYPIVLQTTPDATERLFSESEIRQQISRYESLLQKQPNHRDALINTALLYQALGEVENSQRYWQQAALLDPNHPVFTQEI